MGDSTTGVFLETGRGHHVTNNRFFGYSGNQLTSGIGVAGGVTNNAIASNLFKEVATPGP